MPYDGSQRYSDYIARATLPASDKAWGEAVAEVAEVRDLGVPRLRPLVLEGRQVKRRAEWERQTRAGKSSRRRQAICMPDRVDRTWEAVPGVLWRPGQMVTIHDPWHGAGAWLLASVELRLDPSEGTVVLQELAHPEAYTPDLPPKPKKTESSW